MIRVVGDVHGKTEQYLKIAKGTSYSLQIGDMGFNYLHLNELDPNHHFVLAGNHDNFEKYNDKFVHQTKHFLGDFGVKTINNFEFFFVRGGYSIDWMYRKEGRDWWKDEELSYRKMEECLDMYSVVQPQTVISHECPSSICDLISGVKYWDGELIKPSNTAKLLQSMFEIHQPKLWIFGHHHKSWKRTIEGTNFICLSELEHLDIGESWLLS